MPDNRIVLRGVMKLLITFSLIGVFWVSLAFVRTNDDPQHAPTTVKRVDLSTLQEGQALLLDWESRPVIVLKRSEQMIKALQQTVLHTLADPNSKRSIQPSWAVHSERARQSEWFVAIATGSDFGCPVQFIAAHETPFADSVWHGGFKDTCRGSRYDLAGRVYADQHATKNLQIPSYRIEGSALLLGAQ